MNTKWGFANWLGKEYGFTSYLEISTLTTGNEYHLVDEKIFPIKDCLNYEVPLISKWYPDRQQEHQVALSSYQDHLKRLKGRKFEVILVDSYHTYEQTKKDLKVALKLLKPGGIIIVHDCLPPSGSLVGKVKKGKWCGQSYEAFLEFRAKHPEMEIRTIDMDFGCGIIRPDRSDNQPFQLPRGKTIAELAEWDYFWENRKKLLNLISPEEAYQHYAKEFRYPKLCILIITTNDREIYRNCIKVWEQYLNKHANIHGYFLYADPNLDKPAKIMNNKIIIRTKEGKIPGILQKTVKSLQFLKENGLLDQYNYVLRTNLSSFWIFDRLNQMLYLSPRVNYVKAPLIIKKKGKERFIFPSGAGFIMSIDIAKLLAESEKKLDFKLPDDVAIGQWLINEGIPIESAEMYEFTDNVLDNVPERIKRIRKRIYHIRVKNKMNRVKIDTVILKKLLRHFYPNK